MARNLAEEAATKLIEFVDFADDGCWLWTGFVNDRGYGMGRLLGRAGNAHRLVYRALVEDISPELVLDHLCRNRRCVNPDHLEPVPQRTNVLRGIKGLATTCPNGHAYSPENTGHRVGRKGRVWRECRTCKRDRDARKGHSTPLAVT